MESMLGHREGTLFLPPRICRRTKASTSSQLLCQLWCHQSDVTWAASLSPYSNWMWPQQWQQMRCSDFCLCTFSISIGAALGPHTQCSLEVLLSPQSQKIIVPSEVKKTEARNENRHRRHPHQEAFTCQLSKWLSQSHRFLEVAKATSDYSH